METIIINLFKTLSIFEIEEEIIEKEKMKKISKLINKELKKITEKEIPDSNQIKFIEALSFAKYIYKEIEDETKIEFLEIVLKMINLENIELLFKINSQIIVNCIESIELIPSETFNLIIYQFKDSIKKKDKLYEFYRQIISSSGKSFEQPIIQFLKNEITKLVTIEKEKEKQKKENKKKNKKKNGLQILPLLVHTLSTDDDNKRKQFTKLLSRLFTFRNCIFANSYSKLFHEFLGRFVDKNPEIRREMIDFSKNYILNSNLNIISNQNLNENENENVKFKFKFRKY
ncbi:precocious dissociation of sisters 5 isoform a [Anaeramoeba ignava]|uniref:Precocious dissociation of sisters 5 isoform a n=1 Tax=Anaeramoeba ignava TaxID=1746090 RepID=A0A9Q0RC28_ANAIG|nr:precocious dissociation of sisters 5 isoform a [Anaeramoeba ignava]